MKHTRVPMAQATKDKISKSHTDLYERTDETKRKMSEAKLGRTYTMDHRLNMAASQILRSSSIHNTCPVSVALSSEKYDEDTKKILVEKILAKQRVN